MTGYHDRPAQPAVVDGEVFRDVVGRFASGVTVVTTSSNDRRYGTTASAFTSLSIDPPMVLVCLNRTSETQAAIWESGVFCVNILAEGQQDVAQHFAGKGDKFAGPIRFDEGHLGVPVIRETLAYLECEVAETATGGTHTVFMGRVAVANGSDATPLTYFRGRFGRLESKYEESAYRAVREWVLSRQTPLDQQLRPAAIAASVHSSETNVAYALLRLTSEGLVSASEDGGYTPTPVTAELAYHLFRARCAIELGVVDLCVGSIASADVAVLDAFAVRLAAIVSEAGRSLSEFLATSSRFHGHFVGLARSPQLIAAYARLGISELWRRLIDSGRWWNAIDIEHHADLVSACRNGDRARARRLIKAHTRQVTDLVRRLIDEAGGAL